MPIVRNSRFAVSLIFAINGAVFGTWASRIPAILTIHDLSPASLGILIFLAGVSNDPMAEFSPSENFIQNAACPAYLSYESKRAGVRRFIYASSCSVYGYTVDELYDEKSPTTCSYPYGISKLQGENGVMHLSDDKFSVIALRQGTVCGHSDRMRFDLVVNTMFKSVQAVNL